MADISLAYILVAIVALAIIAVLMFFVKGKKGPKKLSRLTAIAFAFVLAGITFGDDRLIGYSLLGIGVAIAVIDMLKKM